MVSFDEYDEDVWITKTGEKIKISALGDNHLLNILNMLYNVYKEHMEHTPLIYFSILEEGQKRGLKIDEKIIITEKDVELAHDAKYIDILAEIESEERQWGTD